MASNVDYKEEELQEVARAAVKMSNQGPCESLVQLAALIKDEGDRNVYAEAVVELSKSYNEKVNDYVNTINKMVLQAEEEIPALSAAIAAMSATVDEKVTGETEVTEEGLQDVTMMS